jgi:propanediol dehydratase small subunit
VIDGRHRIRGIIDERHRGPATAATAAIACAAGRHARRRARQRASEQPRADKTMKANPLESLTKKSITHPCTLLITE